jgi:hypothetical protein
MMREDLQLGRTLCLLKVLRFGLFSAEPKLVLAELLLGGVPASKSAQKELEELKATAVRLGGVEKAADEAWKACPENMRDKRDKRDKGLPARLRARRSAPTR